MSNLKPELRHDKNGKLVTRHVKADALSAKGKTIPAPYSPETINPYSSAPVSLAEYSEAMALVHSRQVEKTKDIGANFSLMSMKTPDSFREVIDMFRSADDHAVKLMAEVMCLPHQDTEVFNRMLLVNLTVIESVAEMYAGLAKTSSPGVATYRGVVLWQAAQRSLRTYGRPLTTKLFKATTLALWVRGFHDSKSAIDIADNLDNLNYIAENFDAVMERRDVIRERKDISKDYIESVINSAPAISGGIL